MDWLDAEIEAYYTSNMPEELHNSYCKMSGKAKQQFWDMFADKPKVLSKILDKGMDFYEQLFSNARYFAERRYCNAR